MDIALISLYVALTRCQAFIQLHRAFDAARRRRTRFLRCVFCLHRDGHPPALPPHRNSTPARAQPHAIGCQPRTRSHIPSRQTCDPSRRSRRDQPVGFRVGESAAWEP